MVQKFLIFSNSLKIVQAFKSYFKVFQLLGLTDNLKAYIRKSY